MLNTVLGRRVLSFDCAAIVFADLLIGASAKARGADAVAVRNVRDCPEMRLSIIDPRLLHGGMPPQNA